MTGSSVIRSQGAKRYNHFTGRSVFISTVRGGRPDKKKTSAQHPVVQRDPFVDPQAFGNEDPVFQYTDPETQDWLLQIIPNLWPLVSPEWKDRFANEAIIDEGFHELLISKDPAYSFAEFSQEYIELVLEALRIRSEEILRQDPSIQEISMFQSYGLQAGGSQPHPHIHLFAHRDASSEVMLRRLMMHRFYDEHRVSLLDATLQEADAEPRLVVYHNDSYAVVCASAPSAAYDLQVLPTPSESHSYAPKGFFADILHNKKRKDLAMALHVATRVLKIALNDPPYNILFRNLSSEGDPLRILREDQRWLGWHIDVRPVHDYKPFAFQPLRGDDEIGVTPEDAAAELRDVLEHPDFPKREQMSWQDQYANTIEMLVQ